MAAKCDVCLGHSGRKIIKNQRKNKRELYQKTNGSDQVSLDDPFPLVLCVRLPEPMVGFLFLEWSLFFLVWPLFLLRNRPRHGISGALRRDGKRSSERADT